MSGIEEIVSDMFSEEVSKRDFLMEKIKNGESISISKTPWTVQRLEKVSDKFKDKLFEKYQNPSPTKINKKEALKMGKPVCPVVIETYADGLKTVVNRGQSTLKS